MVKKKVKTGPGGAREGAGRPKTVISEEDMAKAEAYALDNCQTGTICVLMGWDHNLVEQRPDIKKRLQLKRAEHKAEIRRSQRKSVKNPVMAIWMGKNTLGQADKQELSGKDGAPLPAPTIIVQPPSEPKTGS